MFIDGTALVTGLALQVLAGYFVVGGPFASVISMADTAYRGYVALSVAGILSA